MIAASTFDANIFLNLFTVAVLVVFAVPVLRSRRKDGVIAEQEKVIKSHSERIASLENERDDARGHHQQAIADGEKCRQEIARLNGAYEELKKYTARDALEEVRGVLVSQERTLSGAIVNLGELVQKDIEVTARLVGALEGQGVTWTHRSSSPSPEA